MRRLGPLYALPKGCPAVGLSMTGQQLEAALKCGTHLTKGGSRERREHAERTPDTRKSRMSRVQGTRSQTGSAQGKSVTCERRKGTGINRPRSSYKKLDQGGVASISDAPFVAEEIRCEKIGARREQEQRRAHAAGHLDAAQCS